MKKLEKIKSLNIYTDEFLNNPITTLNVFNELLKTKLIVEKDMYESGEFLFAAVIDNEKSREILSKLISDFDLYVKHNEKGFDVFKLGQICLCSLQSDHEYLFDNEDKIMWDKLSEKFVFAGMLSEIDK